MCTKKSFEGLKTETAELSSPFANKILLLGREGFSTKRSLLLIIFFNLVNRTLYFDIFAHA